MQRMATSMNEIAVVNQKLKSISKVIRDIARKAGVINEIAFKTQVVSFNASIEAVRAGAAGKGFAVVAAEVGNLAKISGQAAKEIETLLASSVDEVTEVIEAASQKIQGGQTSCEAAGAKFEEIKTAIASISQSIVQITDATKEQEAGIRQTTKALDQMNIATGQAETLAQANSGLARSLIGEANQLCLVASQLKETIIGASKRSGQHGSEALFISPAEHMRSSPIAPHAPVVPSDDKTNTSVLDDALIERLAARADVRNDEHKNDAGLDKAG